MASELKHRFVLYNQGLIKCLRHYLLCPSLGYIENTEIPLRYISKGAPTNIEQLSIPCLSQISSSFDFVCHWLKDYPTGTGRVGALSGKSRALPGPGPMEKALEGG